MASKIKVDQLETADGTGTIALQNQLSGMTTASLPTVTTDKLGTGAVLQVVQNTYSSTISTTSTSFGGTGLYVDITPSSTSSKILTFFTTCAETNGSAQNGYFQTYREISGNDVSLPNGTRIYQAATSGSPTNTHTLHYLDSPNTTSLCRYRLKMAAASGTILVAQRATSVGVAIAMEIAG